MRLSINRPIKDNKFHCRQVIQLKGQQVLSAINTFSDDTKDATAHTLFAKLLNSITKVHKIKLSWLKLAQLIKIREKNIIIKKN